MCEQRVEYGDFQDLVEVLKGRYLSAMPAVTDGAPQERVVLVLGAAASQGSGLPLWGDKELKETVLAKAEKQFAAHDAFLKEAWAMLGPSIGQEKPEWKDDDRRKYLLELASLDQICAVASRYAVLRGAIVEELRSTFAPWPGESGPPPQLGYELIAHLLKHRFIDHVVTLNFDEVLDQAIENELGQGDYVTVISEHHVSSEEVAQKPHIIKLHGTISQPATIRFTTDRTGMLAPQMIDVLDRVLLGNGVGKAKAKIRIVSLGYSWRDHDLAHWTRSRSDRIEDVHVVTLASDAPDALLPRDGRPPVRFVLPDQLLTNTKHDPSLDLILWAVWKSLWDELSAGEHPVMPASRHAVLAYLFAPREWTNARRSELLNEHSREMRFRAELLLHTVECKGMINLSVMAQNRRLHRYRPSSRRAVHDFLDGYHFLQRNPFADVRETYFATFHEIDDFIDWLMLQGGFERARTLLVPKLTPSGKMSLSEHNAQRFLKREVPVVFWGPEVEIVPSRDPRHEWVFVDPKPLETFLVLQSRTIGLLQQRWSHLLVIAESGAWLSEKLVLKALRQKSRCRVLCVETSERALSDWHLRAKISADLQKRRQALLRAGNCELDCGRLAWWKHNRHLTLAYDVRRKQYVGGIYFRRRLKSSQISPVYVEREEDCAELLLTFLSYATRIIGDMREESVSGPSPRANGELLEFSRLLKELHKISDGAPVPKPLREKKKELRQHISDYLERP